MLKRFQNYVFLPNRVRKNADRLVLGLALTWSWYSILSGASGPAAAKQGLALIFVGMVITTVWNATVALRPISADTTRITIKRRPVLTSALAALTIAFGISTKHLEAEILNKRLRRFVERKSLSDEDANSVANALDVARQDRILVSASAVSAVGTKLQNAEYYSDYLHRAAQSAAATQSTLHGAAGKGNRSVVDRLPNYSVYEQCYIPKMQLSLDTKAFFGSYIENSVVSYSGGPVILENSEFRNCEFIFSESRQAIDLLLLLTQRNDPDFLYEPDEIMLHFPNTQLIEKYRRV
jgi:hypothetical protein